MSIVSVEHPHHDIMRPRLSAAQMRKKSGIMVTEDIQLRDFWAVMGEEFFQAICPPVALEEASPQECCEPLRQVLGSSVTPRVLAALTEADLHRLAEAFGAIFDVPPTSPERLRRACSLAGQQMVSGDMNWKRLRADAAHSQSDLLRPWFPLSKGVVRQEGVPI